MKKNNSLSKKCIIRADRAGVFFGTLVAKESSEVTLANARKLYYWSGANTVEDLALRGVLNSNNCKFTDVVEEITINNYLQILPCTEKAISNIENVTIWKAQ